MLLGKCTKENFSKNTQISKNVIQYLKVSNDLKTDQVKTNVFVREEDLTRCHIVVV